MKNLYLIKEEVFSFPVYNSKFELDFLNRKFDQKNIVCIRLDEIEYDFCEFKHKLECSNSNSYSPGVGRDGHKYYKVLIDNNDYLIEKKYVFELKEKL